MTHSFVNAPPARPIALWLANPSVHTLRERCGGTRLHQIDLPKPRYDEQGEGVVQFQQPLPRFGGSS